MKNNQEAQCVVVKKNEALPLTSVQHTMTIKGFLLSLPSSELFEAEDGSLYIVEHYSRDYSKYTSLKHLIEEAKSAVVIKNFSGPTG